MSDLPASPLARRADDPAFYLSLLTTVRDMTPCQSTALCELSADGSTYEVRYRHGALRDSGCSLAAAGNLCLWLDTNDTYLTIPDTSGVFAYLEECERKALCDASVRLCAPICGTEGLLAIVLVIDERPDWTIPEATARRLAGFLKDISATYEAASRHRTRPVAVRTLYRAAQLVVAGQLAATIAHEVRNPLASLRSTIQYVIDSGSPWALKQELLGGTFRELDRIDDTVSNVLTLSRPREVILTHADVPRIAGEAVKLIQPYAGDRRITLHISLERPFSSLIDVRELRQVFVNLLLNACQAMLPGGRLVVSSGIVFLEGPVPPADYGVVTIEDSGPGIPARDLEKVFEPFYTTKEEGTGLGLPVCLEIVGRHGGHLDLRCPPEGGTVASVYLPLSEGS